ncbi:MAG: ATP-binding protein [Phycisphaerae bacterium]
MGSIRLQLMFWCSGAIALLLALLGIGLYLTLSHSLESQFNDSLTARATVLVDTLDWDTHRGFHVNTDFTPVTGSTTQGIPRYYQIWTPDGKTVLHPPMLGRRGLKFLIPQHPLGTFTNIDLPDDRDGRELVIRFQEDHDHDDEDARDHRHDGPGHVGDGHKDRQDHDAPPIHPPHNYILAVARPTNDLDDTLAIIGWSLAISCTMATVLSAILIAWLVHRGFRPVDTIAEQIAGVGTTHLKDRISTENIPCELFPIVDRLNKLLQRVEAAVIREKALSADMAHELRTPLAGLRTAAEVALTRPRSPEEYQRTLRQSLEISVQMQEMVEHLLTLARLEARAWTQTAEPCSLNRMLDQQLDRYRSGIISHHLAWDKSGVSPASVIAPPELLLLVLRNVLDNAIDYVNENGTIRVALESRDDGVILTVANTGSAVSAQQACQVFERFWRGDTSRTDQGRHSGLGLSIVQNVMRQLGGTVKVDSSVGGWFAVVLFFPKHGGDGLHDI